MQLGGEVACHLLLAGGDLGRELVDPLSNRCETKRHRLELLLIERSGGRRDGGRSGLRDGSLRRQPAKLWVGVRDSFSGRIAIGLPSQCGCHTDAERDQEARGSLAGWQSPDRWLAG